jgi:hypothetical protein
MERRGTVPFRTRPLHRFMGEAIVTRTEVLSVLHLLDKPDEAWDDPAIDLIYDDLRGEFDLRDRYAALELKLRAIQESLELLVDVARDRRLLLLEITIVFLIITKSINCWCWSGWQWRSQSACCSGSSADGSCVIYVRPSAPPASAPLRRSGCSVGSRPSLAALTAAC